MNKNEWFNLTRKIDFLWKSGALLAGVLLLLGVGISFFNTSRMDYFNRVSLWLLEPEISGSSESDATKVKAEWVTRILAESLNASIPFYEQLGDISFAFSDLDYSGVITMPEAPGLSEDQLALVENLALSCSAFSNSNALHRLELLAGSESPIQESNYALGLAYQVRGKFLKAISAIDREVELYETEHARLYLVGMYQKEKKFDVLEALSTDPDYKELISARILQQIALDRMDWPMILKTFFPASYGGSSVEMICLALLTGLVWAMILIRFHGSLSDVAPFILPAMVLGALSANATLLVVFFQEYQLGFDFGSALLPQSVYCFFIGVKEEGLKLLFFVPLIPWLVRKESLFILTVAGLVGLGFAVEENIGYFEASMGVSAVGRFVTANFLHIVLTAMCGLTLTRACAYGGAEIANALLTFVAAIAVHSLYDAFIIIPALSEFSWLTLSIFILMSYHYFGWLRYLRDSWSDPFSISASFTYGIIIILSVSFAFYAWQMGAQIALHLVLSELLSVGVIMIMFYREIPETLS